ncbi:MAG: Nif11-like leader peptide family RiPP precursor [Clostridiales bacterium]|nr:Nif11-like leader peptide family RiPP precursor [Clostridiales bacterium]
MGVKEFKDRIASDTSFANKFSRVQTPEDLVKLANQEGFSFTVDDVRNNTELSDSELKSTVGGADVLASTYFVSTGTVFAKNYFVQK